MQMSIMGLNKSLMLNLRFVASSQHALHAVLRCVNVLLCRYENFLFYGSSKTKEMCYYTHLAGITKVFNVLGILSGKKTHAPRGSGARDTHERRYSPVMHIYQCHLFSKHSLSRHKTYHHFQLPWLLCIM